MPIYEYECRKCGHRFDRIEGFDSSPRKKCPECAGRAERVLPSGVGFQFKGSGFYATDYAKKEKKSDAAPTRNETKPEEKED
ncbi:MAG: FmdB family zinc ribbon protein [bacterium]